MKKLFVAIAVFVCWLGSPSARAVTVAPGSPLVVSFSHLPFVGRNDSFFQSGAGAHLVGDLLDVGDNIRIEFFENSLADLTFFQDINSATWPVPSDTIAAGLAFRAFPTPPCLAQSTSIGSPSEW